MTPTVHTPVLLHEVVALLNVQQNDTIVDCTLGGAGHAYALAATLSRDGLFIGIDLDRDAIGRGEGRLNGLSCKKIFVEDTYRNLGAILTAHGVDRIDKVLIDLGLSSDQLDVSGRGFSFTKDESLSMAFGQTPVFDAREIVNTWDEENLITIFRQYGEEVRAGRIARAIVHAREAQPIDTTQELVAVIEQALPSFIVKTARKHPATRIFQALRMTVNDEYQSLTEGLETIIRYLAPHGRVAVITFESVMDRVVKRAFKQWANDGIVTLLTKKPVIPSSDEIRDNPRSRSAKLRVALKI